MPAPQPQTETSDWPENHDAVRFIVRSEPDHRGRQAFFALFWREGRRNLLWHGGADLQQHVSRARAEDAAVEIVERFGEIREAA